MAKTKWIEGFEGLYEISKEGEVFSHKRKVRRKLLPQKDRKGYLQVRLYNKDKIGFTKRIHNLVAEAFLGVKGSMQIDHIDGDKSNNKVSNLQFLTNQQNCEKSLAKHWKLTKSNGESIVVFNLNSFCLENRCKGRGDFHRLMSGKRKSAYGFTKVERIS